MSSSLNLGRLVTTVEMMYVASKARPYSVTQLPSCWLEHSQWKPELPCTRSNDQASMLERPCVSRHHRAQPSSDHSLVQNPLGSGSFSPSCSSSQPPFQLPQPLQQSQPSPRHCTTENRILICSIIRWWLLYVTKLWGSLLGSNS